MHGWMIDRDYLAENGEPTRVGYGQVSKDQVEADLGMVVARQINVETDLKASDIEQPVRFRTLDDDGGVSYGGVVSYDWLLGAEDEAYHILKFAEADAGDTDVQFRATDLPERFVQRHRDCGAVFKSGDTEWVLIYS
jgi:hypothetical protein